MSLQTEFIAKTRCRRTAALALAAAGAVALMPCTSAHATVGTWAKGAGAGVNWNTTGAGGWTNGTAPNAVGDSATLDQSATGGSSGTTVSGSITVGTVSMFGTTTAIDRSWTIPAASSSGLTLSQDGIVGNAAMATLTNAQIANLSGILPADPTPVNSMLRFTTPITLADDVAIVNNSNSGRTFTGSATAGSINFQGLINGTGNLYISNNGGNGATPQDYSNNGNDPVHGAIAFGEQGAWGGNTYVQKGAVTFSRGDAFSTIATNTIYLGSVGGGDVTFVQNGSGNGFSGFNMENSFVVVAGSGGTITFGAIGNPTSTTSTNNSIRITSSTPGAATVTLNDNLMLTSSIPLLRTFEIGDQIMGVGGITKIGTGAATLSNPANNYTGATTVNAGFLTLPAGLTKSSAMNVNGGVMFLNESGTHDHIIKTGALSVTLGASGGKLDLNDNKLITTTPVATIQSYIVSGQGTVTGGQPAWDGASGIVTSETQAKTTTLTTLAVASAADVKGISGVQTAMWGGQTVTPASTLVMYTYGGDATLNGKIDADDYFRIDSNYNKSGTSTGYFNGDFNYDGQINGDDYAIIDANYSNQTLGQFPTGSLPGGVSAVPEPASVMGLGLLAGAAYTRRRRAR